MRLPLRHKQALPLALYFLAVLLWIGWAAALLKIFQAWLILAVSVIVTLLSWRFLRPAAHDRYHQAPGEHRDRVLLIVALVLILAVSALNFYFFHDSLSGNRDEGVYANDAVYLANHGNLPVPTFEGRDTRLFLNTVWDAELYGLFGYAGIRLSNVIPYALALLCIFLLVGELSGNYWAGLVAILLISFSYPFLWFTRRTNNEIFFFSLFWISVYLLYRCFRSQGFLRTDFTLYMLVTPLMAFVRPEGLVVLGVGLMGAFFIFLRQKWRALPYGAIPFSILAVVMILSLAGGFKLMSTKYDMNIFATNSSDGGVVSAVGTAGSGSSNPSIYARKGSYTTMAMIKFGFFPALLLIIPFFILLFLQRGNRIFALFLLVMVIPFFYFYLRPSIGFDFPWFLRRFTAVVIPLALIAFSFTIFKLGKAQAAIIVAAYLGLTLLVSAPVLIHQDYPGVVARMDELAASLPTDCKVLADRYTLGEFTLSGPLFFLYDRDVLQITPWNPVSLKEVGDTDTVYLVTNSEDWRDNFKSGTYLFDDSINVNQVSIVKEMDVPVSYLQPTCEFHRAGNVNSWTSMDYRIALSNVEVPSKTVKGEYRLLVVRMDIDTAVVASAETGAQ